MPKGDSQVVSMRSAPLCCTTVTASASSTAATESMGTSVSQVEVVGVRTAK